MLIATNKGLPVLQTDGDSAFWKVNNHLPAHALPPGVAAAAVNCRFDQGQAGPRFGVMLSPWGNPYVDRNAAAGLTWPGIGIGGFTSVTLEKLTVGARYYLALGNALVMASDTHLNASRTVVTPGFFVAEQADYILESQQFGGPVTTQIIPLSSTRGYGRFSDPNGFDNAVLITGETRDEDGGLGRAWRILPNNAPQEIPLNGHDVWGAVSLVQCYNGLLLLREGNERHYFAADAIGTNTIQLNCLPAWANGDEVQLVASQDGSAILGASAPNLNAPYFVRNAGSNQISLYDTRAHAVAGGGTGKLLFDSATGAFYAERISTLAGFYGNGAPVLLLQGSDSQSPFEVGFVAAPTIAVVSNTSNVTQILTAVSHRLAPGDAVLVSGVTGVTASTTYYAVPLSNDLFQLYDTVDHALAGGATGLVPLTTSGQSGTVKKVNASGQPMAPARLGISFLQRAILVNGRCNLLIGDPNDPLHFTPMQATLNANLGENDSIVALMTMPYDTLLIIKNNSVLALSNLSSPNTSWLLQEVTREYGGVASLATANVGSDRWLLSRRGVASIAQTQQGQLQGVALPKSDDIGQRLQSVDWLHASGACAAEWNNRVFWAVPLKGQVYGATEARPTITNNGTLVYNTINQGWEDLWQGDWLTPLAFARLTIGGEERLTFATADGLVCWLTDDFQDGVQGAADLPIATSLTTRGYFGGQVVLALKGELNWDTFAPDLTVSVQTAGVNEITTVLERTYDKTRYQVANAGTYDPATSKSFAAPHRADYSPDAVELLEATLDTFQNTTEILRMRVRDRVPQVVIANAAGAVRVNSVTLAAKAVQTSGQQT